MKTENVNQSQILSQTLRNVKVKYKVVLKEVKQFKHLKPHTLMYKTFMCYSLCIKRLRLKIKSEFDS